MWKNNSRKALQFVYKYFFSTYKDLLAKGYHSMLYISRLRIIATEVYKALNEISPKYMEDMIKKVIVIIHYVHHLPNVI